MMNPCAALTAHELYRFYRSEDEETQALRGVSLSVAGGELVAVTGPSGSGKSTLLSCLAGTDDPDGGSVHIAGVRISHRPERARCAIRASSIGLLFQSTNLFEHLTITQNLTLIGALAKNTNSHRVDELLTGLGIGARAGAYPSQLSGGELARAGLGAALVNDPAVLLADEPTGELDSVTEAVVLDLLRQAADRGAAVVVASHSVAVTDAADRVIRLRDGRMVG
ncbi:ABC transporter ATP-binding protein [Mycobacterium sp. ENV421]|uniref:ABC transporter ATP-binding protein n=1 Tax=Mycobacterium sp. ENV421 TaxID=1213407 RepID=UPI000C9A50F5|nr:ATP-binding cassette domain-containing protein [Mycobacterium sp. ENV421]PND57292.1 ABC transporter ATP-binding protein [Mycobacterium sp. ENV421]